MSALAHPPSTIGRRGRRLARRRRRWRRVVALCSSLETAGLAIAAIGFFIVQHFAGGP